MKIDVLYQFNEKYAPYAGVSITSLFDNNRHVQEIRIFILGEELSKFSVAQLQKLADQYGRQICFVDTVVQIRKMKEAGMPAYRGSYAANLRLFLPNLLDESVDELIYLDADTIVAENLEKLLAAAGEEYPLYMALDSLGAEHKAEIGLGEDDLYYNSGVIVFHLKEWKKRQLSERIIRHVKEVRANYPAPDQDLLNVVCCGEIGKLAPQYNFQPVHAAFEIKTYCKIYGTAGYYSEEELARAKEQPCIYHFFRFLGEFPWDEGNVHPDNRLFDQYLEISPWKGCQKKKSEVGMVFRIEKLLYQILPGELFLRLFKLAHRSFVKKSNRMSLQDKVNPKM